jgi:hypothetical protein
MCSRAVRRPAAWIALSAAGPPIWLVTCARSPRSRSTVLISSETSAVLSAVLPAVLSAGPVPPVPRVPSVSGVVMGSLLSAASRF